MPSLYEGFGLPALEAMKYGKPVIGSKSGSIEEVVQNGGMLIDPVSAEEIARSMKELAGDKNLYEHLSDAARLRSREFSWDSAAEQTLKVLIST